MSLRWRAVYDDGTHLEEDHRPGGAYAAIDRARLRQFQVFADSLAIVPVIEVEVPAGRRLVYRLRKRQDTAGGFAWALLIALESADRSLVDVRCWSPDGEGTLMERRDSYGAEWPFHEPELVPSEV